MRIYIHGMQCTHCAEHIASALKTLKLHNININLTEGYADASGKSTSQEISDVIATEGYTVTKIISDK